MNEFIVRGMHCKTCTLDIENRLNDAVQSSKIRIDFDHRRAYIPASVNMKKLKRVAAFDKIIFEPIDKNAQAASHDHHHGHSHDHNHGHDVDFSSGDKAARNMKIVLVINVVFSALEFFFGLLFNSSAILSDAVHDLGDAISIGLAWFFQKISTREANERYSFGHQRFSSLGALITGTVLIMGSVVLIMNTVPRLFNPQPVNYDGMFWLAIFAIAANGYSAWLLSQGSSANESMLNLHLLEDVLGWVGVLIVSVVVRFTNWYILDPILSLIIAAFIIYKTWPLFKKTAQVFLEAVPEGIDIKDIEEHILEMPDVHNLSHLHIWSIDGEEHAMSVTLSTESLSDKEYEELKEAVRLIVAPQNVTHTTIEIMADPERVLY